MDFVREARSVELRFVSGRGHYDTVIRAIREARTSVWIATANLKGLMVEDLRWSAQRKRASRAGYRSIVEIFAELESAGVDLRLLHATPASTAFRRELARHPRLARRPGTRGRRPVTEQEIIRPGTKPGRFEMRLCPRVHLKAVMVDGSFLYLGSANFTGAGLGAKGSGRRNFEIGLVTDDAPLLDDVQELFDRIWRGRECKACKLRDQCPQPLEVHQSS